MMVSPAAQALRAIKRAVSAQPRPAAGDRPPADFYLADTPSPSLLKRLLEGEGGVQVTSRRWS